MADNDRSGVTRRAVLAGFGVATGATVLGAALPAHTAEAAAPAPDPAARGPRKDDGSAAPADARLRPLAAIDFKPERRYFTIPPSTFTNDDGAGGRDLLATGAAPRERTEGLYVLSAPIVLPVQSRLQEIVVGYSNPGPPPVNANAYLYKKAPDDIYRKIGEIVLPPLGSEPYGSFLLEVDELYDGNAAYELSVSLPGAGQSVSGVLVGYVPAPSGFVALNPIPRVLDTRTTGGKLKPDQERVVALNLPAGASAAVLNLTVTDTEGAGFVALFPADVGYPGNSSINWFGVGQNLANALVTGTDTGGQVRIRGGAAATNVVIDVLGYLL
jgi:hypothetical protein